MFRKNFIVAFLGAFLMCGAAFAGAVTEAQEQAIAAGMAAIANEPALVQADVDMFLKLAPKAAEAVNDPTAMLKLFQDSGVSPQRFGAISSKITVGLMMAQGVTREQIAASGQFLDFMIPNDDELAVIKQNTDAILKSMGQ